MTHPETEAAALLSHPREKDVLVLCCTCGHDSISRKLLDK